MPFPLPLPLPLPLPSISLSLSLSLCLSVSVFPALRGDCLLEDRRGVSINKLEIFHAI